MATDDQAFVDVGRLMRIAATVRGVLDAIGYERAAAGGGLALHDAYKALHGQSVSALEPDVQLSAEFAQIFPHVAYAEPADPGRQERIEVQMRAELGKLAGWLDGAAKALVADANAQLEAAAYAEARIKAEHGIGFRPPEQGRG